MQILLISSSKVGISRFHMIIQLMRWMEAAHKLKRIHKPTYKLSPWSAFLILSLSSYSLPIFLTFPFSSRFQVTLLQLIEQCYSEFFVDAKQTNKKEKNNLPKKPTGSENSYCWPAGKPQAKTNLGSTPTHFSSCTDSTGSAETNGTGL